MKKMGASKIFQPSQMPREPKQQDEANEDLHDIEIEEILEDEVLTSPRTHTHYYVSIGDESYSPSNESSKSNPIASCEVINPTTSFKVISNLSGCSKS